MREEGYITPSARSRPRGARGCASPPHPRAGRRPRRLREGVPAPAVPRAGRRRPPAGLAGAHDFVPAVQAAAERAVARGLRAAGRAGPAGARWWRSTRRPATSWPWWAARDFGASPFNRAVRSRRQPGSAFKPFVYAAALRARVSRPVTVLDDLQRGDGARPRGVGAAQRRRRGAGRADPARGALEVEQPGGGRAAAADRHGPRAASWPGRSGCATCPTCRRWRSAPASSRRST